MTNNLSLCTRLLRAWFEHSEQYWHDLPGHSGLGCYGSGYNSWGVQTTQKYLGALAALAERGPKHGDVPASVAQRARARALAALRFNLRSHRSGDLACTDATQWGHTWISELGIERMLYGVYLLEPHLTREDKELLQRVLVSEAEWVLNSHIRGDVSGIVGDVWGYSGKNNPESNLWNGAALWRAACAFPDHAQAAFWRVKAHEFLINSVSVAADAHDERVLAGKPISEWHRGANFFPHYALDHHGYLNVGYKVICASNAAILHFDAKLRGWPAPESLYHHQRDLWALVRRLIFSDGRLARIGGDTRVRYAYCQEYLLPALLFGADHCGDEHAAFLVEQQLELIRHEAEFNGDGSFYGKRLTYLIRESPYYYTRLESDRACVLGMLLAYQPLCATPSVSPPFEGGEKRKAYELSVAGGWCEPDHGSVMHRSPTRLASFGWRAQGLAQGMCLPPDDGHLAEWSRNLAGVVTFIGDQGHRQLLEQHIDPFEGGFVTCGRVGEGVKLAMAEGWTRDKPAAIHSLAFAALPDGHTVVGLQYCRTENARVYLAEAKGLHLNIPNDLYNEFSRKIEGAGGERALRAPAEREEVVNLGSRWACVEGRIGAVGIYGAEQLQVNRAPKRRGGKYESLFVDELCWGCDLTRRAVNPDTVVLDVGWAALASADAAACQRVRAAQIPAKHPAVRAVRITALDGGEYIVVANFSAEPQDISELTGNASPLAAGTGELAPAHAAVWVKS